MDASKQPQTLLTTRSLPLIPRLTLAPSNGSQTWCTVTASAGHKKLRTSFNDSNKTLRISFFSGSFMNISKQNLNGLYPSAYELATVQNLCALPYCVSDLHHLRGYLLEHGSDEHSIVALGEKNDNRRVVVHQRFKRWSVVRSFCWFHRLASG